jgi:hypothetical protein
VWKSPEISDTRKESKLFKVNWLKRNLHIFSGARKTQIFSSNNETSTILDQEENTQIHDFFPSTTMSNFFVAKHSTQKTSP